MKQNNKIIFVDLDNTLCSPIGKSDAVGNIEKCKPYDLIKYINKLYDKGYTIVIYTNRKSICKSETIKWLTKYEVKYTRIRFNKPRYSLLLDDRSYPPYNFLTDKSIEDYMDKVNRWDFNKGGPFNL
jgi:hypothetical protein